MHTAGEKGYSGDIKQSIVFAALLVAWDVVFAGSLVMSSIFCPLVFLFNLLKSVIVRPGWRPALVNIGIPVLTYLLVRANNDFQLTVANRNAQRVVAACEEYHAANGNFPKRLDELVPKYMDSVPVAKYCLGQGSRFNYVSSSTGPTMLWWEVVSPYFRKTYNFNERSWSCRD